LHKYTQHNTSQNTQFHKYTQHNTVCISQAHTAQYQEKLPVKTPPAKCPGVAPAGAAHIIWPYTNRIEQLEHREGPDENGSLFGQHLRQHLRARGVPELRNAANQCWKKCHPHRGHLPVVRCNDEDPREVLWEGRRFNRGQGGRGLSNGGLCTRMPAILMPSTQMPSGLMTDRPNEGKPRRLEAKRRQSLALCTCVCWQPCARACACVREWIAACGKRQRHLPSVEEAQPLVAGTTRHPLSRVRWKLVPVVVYMLSTYADGAFVPFVHWAY
jgi:hypothetical protein